MIRDKDNTIRSGLFAKIPHLTHAFSTRSFGDMRSQAKRSFFLDMLGLNTHELYWKTQIHSSRVHIISSQTDISTLSDADSAVLLKDTDNLRHIVLTVRYADCVPLLFAEPNAHIIAVAHAGWQGTLGNIAVNTIDAMKQNGADISHIRVAIGPHIGGCCYRVDQLRAQRFAHRYPSDSHIVRKENSHWFIDLGNANKKDILSAGIPDSHIDMDSMCTCHETGFFSYRKDTPGSYGVMMGVLAWV